MQTNSLIFIIAAIVSGLLFRSRPGAVESMGRENQADAAIRYVNSSPTIITEQRVENA